MEAILARGPDGTLSVLFIPPELAEILLELPSILDNDERPEVQSRRYQDPLADDDEANAEWQRMMRPDLLHLFGEARDVVDQDLELLRSTLEHPAGARLDIPPQHTNAWISALQLARVSLAAEHGLDGEDAEVAAQFEKSGAGLLAMARVAIFGQIQGVLLELVAPGVTDGGPDADVGLGTDIEFDEDDDFGEDDDAFDDEPDPAG